MMLTRLRGLPASQRRGFSLAEVLTAITVFGLLSGALLTTVLGANASVRDTRQANNLNEEARLAINRITRELRQAERIVAVSAPDGKTSLTFQAEFNNIPGIQATGDDPEEITYIYQPPSGTQSGRIALQVTDATGNPVAYPILAANVSAFALDYRSHRYQFDANGDGITSWQELDANVAAGGNQNGVLDVELTSIDSVVLQFTVLTGNRRQTYRTQVSLRNRF